jgi:diaminopimelate decarboxylase
MFDDLRAILPSTAEAPDGVLHVGGVSVTELAETYGTPVIAYDARHVRDAARAWIDAFEGYPAGASIAYATKAFSTVGLLRMLRDVGVGADVSSLGELEVALRAGVDPARIVLHGNNKSREELDAAVASRVGLIVLDAESELELLEQVAAEHALHQPVLVRVNPDIEVETHRYISTSHGGSKFGVPGPVAARMLERAAASEWLDPQGVHVHLGSQLLDVAPWKLVLHWLAGWARELRDRTGIEIRTLDIGGGLGIAYLESHEPPSPAEIAGVVRTILAQTWVEEQDLHLPHLVVEPGRSIVGQAAVTTYRVGVVKATAEEDIHYVNVDGGMSDNPRPVLYQAQYRALLGERATEPAAGTWWVAGVHCESGDVLVEDAPLPEPRTGDLLVIPATGAYAASMASTYNMVPRCAVVLVEGGEHHLLLRRETVEDLLARDPAAAAVGST